MGDGGRADLGAFRRGTRLLAEKLTSRELTKFAKSLFECNTPGFTLLIILQSSMAAV